MPLAGRGVAGERDLVDAWMFDEGLTDAAAAAGDDVQHARRQTDFFGDLAERERGERRLTRRFQDDGVAGRQCRRNLPHRQQQRKVPRDDRRDDAERLAPRVDEARCP